MKRKVVICLLLVAMIFALAGCDVIEGIIGDLLTSVDSIELSATNMTLTVGGTNSVKATVKGDGAFIEEDITTTLSDKNVAKIEYKSSDNTSFTYEITALAVGSTTVTFDSDLSSDSFTPATLKVTVTSKASEGDIDPNSIVAKYSIPSYSGTAYVSVNGNVPFFTEDEMMLEPYEFYSELDSLGRCGVTIACVCKETMPTEERGEIGSVKPSGWHTVKYDIVSGKYLYNRCHLIGYQLTGENANRSNLITGTRYLNIDGNLVFENIVADYVKETGNHVMYRVTPIFFYDELVARGVLMEGWSVEDDGDGICFNVYCYNVQPGIVIDYATGESHLE